MKRAIAILMLGCSLGLVYPAQGFWWLFGRSTGEVLLQYLEVNGVRVEEAEGAVGIPRDMLVNGMFVVRGRARAGRTPIGAVEISIDDQKSWVQANMAADGTFEYSWAPQPGVEYVLLVKAIATTGRSNKVEDTRLEVRLLDQDMRGMVLEALSRLVESYQNKDAAGFMANVSRQFAADAVVLDRAVRNDFSLFDNITLSFTLSNLAVDRNGRIMVGITFRRTLISTRSGQQFSDHGLTEFTFVQEEGMVKVWAMKVPLIFGLSDAAEVATGTVGQPANQQVIVVSDNGEVRTVSASSMFQQSESGDFQLENEQGWNFADGMVVDNFDRMDVQFSSGGGGTGEGMLIFAYQHGGGRDLGFGNIDDVNDVPATGYDQVEAPVDAGSAGQLYALRTIDGKYAVIQIVNVAGGRVRIRYKYQPDGTNFF